MVNNCFWPCVRLPRLQLEARMVRFRFRSSSCQRRWECPPLVLVVRTNHFHSSCTTQECHARTYAVRQQMTVYPATDDKRC